MWDRFNCADTGPRSGSILPTAADIRVRHFAAKDRTFKTVRPNQGTASGACDCRSPPLFRPAAGSALRCFG